MLSVQTRTDLLSPKAVDCWQGSTWRRPSDSIVRRIMTKLSNGLRQAHVRLLPRSKR